LSIYECVGDRQGAFLAAASERWRRQRLRRRDLQPQRGCATPLVIASHTAGGSGAGAGFAFRYLDEARVMVLAPDSRA
jgi:hypothetical protein